MELKEQIDKARLPRHIAVIMDGNGRWAKQQGAQRTFGHQSAVKAVRNTVEGCAELGVEYLTLYAFSTENWYRPEEEVNALMGLLVSTLNAEMKTLMDNNIRLRAIGDLPSLPESCYNELTSAIQASSANTGMNLIIALSYSSRWEITKAMKDIAAKVKKGETEPSAITEQTIAEHLTTAAFPDPELLIRTSGEQRISNFLLWQIAYTEIYITPVLWPDFSKDDLYKAILDFQKRERRFGMTSEQVTTR